MLFAAEIFALLFPMQVLVAYAQNAPDHVEEELRRLEAE